MKIALFSDTYPPEINGVATSTANLRDVLIAHGHKVLLVTTNPFSKLVTYENGILRIPGMELKRLYGYRASMFYNEEAMRYILAFAPEVVHCQTDMGIGVFGMLTARKLSCGIIYTFHTMIEDYAYYVTHGHFDRFARHTVRWFFRQKSNLFTEFIAPSQKIKDYLRSIGIDTHVSVLPTGIDFSRFDPQKADKRAEDELRKKYGIAKDEKVIISLGRIAKEKSIDLLLRGYAKFLEKDPKIKTKFVITGLGPAEEELKELSKTLGIADKVIFTGKCQAEETPKYYHLGDIFASASITETQGLTFMEAMASHLIVMARYDDNLAGTIKDGETGYFFTDEEDFSNKLLRLLTLDKKQRDIVEKNALEVIDIYSLEHFCQNVMEVYERVRKKKW